MRQEKRKKREEKKEWESKRIKVNDVPKEDGKKGEKERKEGYSRPK